MTGEIRSKSSIALIAILSFLFLLAFVPFVSAYSGDSPTVESDTGVCNSVSWTNPQGQYIIGQTVTSAITTDCTGQGAWALCLLPVSSLFSCLDQNNIVASGTFSCPCPSALTLLNQELPIGHYAYFAVFGKSAVSLSITISTFLVAAQFPLGSLMAVITPIGAFLGFWGLGKRRKSNHAFW